MNVKKIAAISLVLVFAVTAIGLAQLANVHSRWIKGSLVYYQDNAKRLIDGVGVNVVKYIEDFVSTPTDDTSGDPTQWTVTVVETGGGGDSTFIVTDGSGGLGLMTTDNAENDGVSGQIKGESFELTSDQELYCGFFDVTINDVDQTDVFIGLAVTDTAILGAVTDSIGFRSVDESAVMNYLLEKDSTETTGTAQTMVDATAYDFEFYFDGTNVEFFVDGTSVISSATNLPDDEAMRVSWEFLTGETTANTCQIDRITCIQIGR